MTCAIFRNNNTQLIQLTTDHYRLVSQQFGSFYQFKMGMNLFIRQFFSIYNIANLINNISNKLTTLLTKCCLPDFLLMLNRVTSPVVAVIFEQKSFKYRKDFLKHLSLCLSVSQCLEITKICQKPFQLYFTTWLENNMADGSAFFHHNVCILPLL